MSLLCDLHTHSIFSDGTFTPEQIIDSSIATGIAAVALTDHNTVDGISRFLSYAEHKDIDAIAGAEFSVDYEGRELHLLGLFLPEASFPEISALMINVKKRKEQSNADLVETLARDGFIIDYEKIKRSTPNGSVNRAHIAAELTEKGYTPSIKAAFSTLLSKAGPYYKEPERINVFEMIDYIGSIGALSILAHPFLNLSQEELLCFLKKARGTALAGMECYYSTYTPELQKLSIAIAKDFSLEASGGSDFHGSNKPDIFLGCGRGDLCVPYSVKKNLESRLK